MTSGSFLAGNADNNKFAFFFSDIVYVATVHITHCKLSCLFLNSGKAVLCEKPLALNIKQVQKMINVAKKNNVFFMEVG